LIADRYLRDLLADCCSRSLGKLAERSRAGTRYSQTYRRNSLILPEEPKQKPTFEDLVRNFGYDNMEFFSDMVRPDQHEEREEDANLPTAQTPMTPEEERAVIEHIESEIGRNLTPHEINLASDQARSI
jgi:hypothetical protein